MSKNKINKDELNKVEGGYKRFVPSPPGTGIPKVDDTGLKIEGIPNQVENKDSEDIIKNTGMWIRK